MTEHSTAKARWSRRNLMKIGGTAGLTLALAGGAANWARGAAPKRVVVVGGGPGGATAAKYLRRYDPDIRVTMVEPQPHYYTCFSANWVLGGFRNLEKTKQTFDALRDAYGVEVVQDRVVDWDTQTGKARLAGGDTLAFDRIVVAPGIALRWDEVDGMSEADAERVPHAWHGGRQYRILRDQLEAMEDGGTFVMAAPPNPFRCPPGPYERLSLVAHYLKENKPRSKVLCLDPKDGFSKQGLFEQGWAELYGDMIEWVPGSGGGRLHKVDPKTRTAWTQEGFQKHKANVLNVVPPQQAGRIAQDMGLADESGWCPVDQRTFESTRQANVHVIGDAAIAGDMPKSGHAANNQAKMAAAAIAAAFNGWETPKPKLVNTCYSLIGPMHGISVAAVYRYTDGRIRAVADAGGVSPGDADRFFRIDEAHYARGWYKAITDDIYG